MHRFEIFAFEKYRDLEVQVSIHSRQQQKYMFLHIGEENISRKLFCWGDTLRISTTALHQQKLELSLGENRMHNRRIVDGQTDRQTVTEIPITALSRMTLNCLWLTVNQFQTSKIRCRIKSKIFHNYIV